MSPEALIGLITLLVTSPPSLLLVWKCTRRRTRRGDRDSEANPSAAAGRSEGFYNTTASDVELGLSRSVMRPHEQGAPPALSSSSTKYEFVAKWRAEIAVVNLMVLQRTASVIEHRAFELSFNA
ncbi:hypothetical protein NA57DRAFT_59191 [Rhizodiscina lignyota]|uniref:Uncharacterized protein n=1 Tax=Rhizodiscina lignyota TaxID=1504668 RepID=A0A9P4M3V8_9PEZI|nr:hypothetical protein NA57DRAFT_59191 [Rhizodiscina lignyota]